ncbi:hypothetical protein [Haliangium sp.]|uniref:hypothetical protein n=1 Tax=Haliangium sp. TaxID=2663208 RepID=UPI003D12C742
MRALLLASAAAMSAGACGGGGGDDNDAAVQPPDAPQAPAEIMIAFDRNGDLYRVDPATAQATLALDTTYGAVADIGVVSSAFYVTDSSQLWLGMGGISECEACIFTLDATTGAATLLAENEPRGLKGIPGLARSPAGGGLYTSTGNGRTFYYIDPTTGIAQAIGQMGAEGKGAGMTFAANGTLYAALDTVLASVDLSTGATTQVGIFNGFTDTVPDYAINSMVTYGGAIYGILLDRDAGVDRTTYLVQVDITTAAVTSIGALPTSMEGLAVAPGDLLP